MRNKFFFTAGIVWILSGVASGATDGADAVDYEREWKPYVTLRGGWLFGGKTKYSDCMSQLVDKRNGEREESLGGAWSGSGEFGVSVFH